MKRLFTLITLLFLAGISYAQDWTITVCSGTPSVTTSTTYGPMYSTGTAGAVGRKAVVYPASQLAGIANKLLTAVYYNRGNNSGTLGGAPNFKVYLKEVSATDWGAGALTWSTAIAGATLVYDGNPTSATGSNGGWKKFPFTTNFLYSGTQNLAMFMEYSNTAAGTSIAWSYDYTSPCVNSPANSNTTKYSNTTGALPTTLGSSNYRRPYIGFDFVTCLNPGNLAVSNLQKTSATITWDPAAGSVGYEYILNQDPATPIVAGTPIGTNSYNASGLTAGTMYYFHVRTICATANSAWTTFSFTTPICAAVYDLKVSNITESSAQLDWSSIAVATNYEYVVSTSDVAPTSSAGTTSTNNISEPVTGLTPNTLYHVFIRSRCSGNDSSTWAQTSFKTFTQCMPPALTANKLDLNQWQISWPDAPAAVAYEYALSGLNTPSIGTTIYTNNVTVAIPEDGEPYYMYVRSKCYNLFNISSWARTELRPPLSIHGKDLSERISIYPNPVQQKLIIKLNGTVSGNKEITISDISGKIILVEKLNSDLSEINMEAYPAGQYLLRYSDNEGTGILRFSKL